MINVEFELQSSVTPFYVNLGSPLISRDGEQFQCFVRVKSDSAELRAKTFISRLAIVNSVCCCRRCGQVPAPAEISSAPHYLGRRGDRLLFQREVQELSEGNV